MPPAVCRRWVFKKSLEASVGRSGAEDDLSHPRVGRTAQRPWGSKRILTHRPEEIAIHIYSALDNSGGDYSSQTGMKKSVVIYARTVGTEPELLSDLCRIVEDRGDVVVATFCDDARIDGKGKNSDWRRLLADLDRIDEIVLADAGHPPGRTVSDLLAILATLTEHGVSLSVPSQGIDTTTGSAAILDLIGVYRRAKRSQAIRQGQAKSSKRNGRPPIPAGVQRQIAAALADGGGIRPTAKKFGVSPGSIMNIRRSMAPIIVEAA